MVGTTAGNPLDRLSNEPRSPLAEPPPPAEVEAELQRIARQRLAPTVGAVVASHSHRSARSLLHRRQPLVGAFDSPAGFAFGTDGTNRKR